MLWKIGHIIEESWQSLEYHFLTIWMVRVKVVMNMKKKKINDEKIGLNLNPKHKTKESKQEHKS